MNPEPQKPWGIAAVTASMEARRAAAGKERATHTSLIDFEELERFDDLLVFAKAAVEGYFSGKHKSPFTGSSAEFADYKEYTQGDSLSRIDWRVYGRTRRLFVRQYEDETDMTAYLLVDASGSMRYGGGKRPSKFHVASRIAAALAYLMHKQGDKAALGLFAETVRSFLPPGGTRRHLHRIVKELEQAVPSEKTGLAAALSQAIPLCKKRGRLVLISDFLDDRAALIDALSQFAHRRFDILLLQTLDPDELHLPGNSAARYIDAETREAIQIDADDIRASYERRMREEITALAKDADQLQIQHQFIDTRRPYLEAIESYMGFRNPRP